jgi:hypothetical protein
MESYSQMHKHSLWADPRMGAYTSKTESRSKITALGVHLYLRNATRVEQGGYRDLAGAHCFCIHPPQCEILELGLRLVWRELRERGRGDRKL